MTKTTNKGRGGARPGAGRPPKENAADQVLNIRLTRSDRERLDKLADLRDVSRSEVVRDLIRKASDE